MLESKRWHPSEAPSNNINYLEATMSRPTELLKQDHRVIERMLKVRATAADRLDRGQEVDPSVFDRSLDFIRQFADYNHHGKEEDILFNAIEQAGIPSLAAPRGGCWKSMTTAGRGGR